MHRLAYTLYYHRPEQLCRRFYKRFVGRFVPERATAVPADCSIRTGQRDRFHALLRGRVAARRASMRQDADVVRRGELCFLGQPAHVTLSANAPKLATSFTRNSPTRAAWQLPHEVDHLWRFHLHYHEFLFDLVSTDGVVHAVSTSDGQSAEDVWSIVASWMATFPAASQSSADDAWHPFCISRRLPVWMMLWHHAPPPAAMQDAVRDSVFQQAYHLANHLELDLGGNHLLENLRTLAIAAVFLDAKVTDNWLQVVETLLRRELPIQCLGSGEHFERTPAYHSIVLELLLEIRDVLEVHRRECSQFVSGYVASMQQFLAAICHPDGEIPLFSDSAFGPAPCARQLLADADVEVQPGVSVVGDYWTYRTVEGDALIFDRGAVAVDYLPAHAHCDLLNLVASRGGERVIVDAGVYDYGDTEMRKYCRGTAAHNVLQVDEIDQCDVWSRFRMGYRGHVLETSEGMTPGMHWAQASHNGYRRVGVPTVNRWVGCDQLGTWYCVDSAKAVKAHQFTNRVRIHPDFKVEQSGPRAFVLKSDQQALELTWLWESGTVAIEEGWYCPEFGQRLAIAVIVWRETTAECYSGWQIAGK